MKRGFTLIEVLVALFILSIAIGGTFEAIIANLNAANLVRDTFVASGLTQEGMEVMRNLRDSDWLAGRAFGTSLPEGLNRRIEWNSLLPLPSDPTAYLRKSADGFYTYTPSDPVTPYQRTVDIVKNSATEYKITVTVTWQERKSLKKVSAEEHLYDWY